MKPNLDKLEPTSYKKSNQNYPYKLIAVQLFWVATEFTPIIGAV